MIDVTLIPIIPQNDNYAYLLEADDGSVAVVDPGDAKPIIDYLESENLKPDVIFITHHHWDHVDGLPDMLEWHDCPVVGAMHPRNKSNVEFTRILTEGESYPFGGEQVQVIKTPGHCREHLCFYFEDSGFVLAGDALFVMGCGRIIDGTPEELFDTLGKLSSLPDATKVYCGHEYTLTNAKFSHAQAPDNSAIAERLKEIEKLRANDEPTIPSTIAQEKKTNLFMQAKSAAEFATLRKSKDNF